MTIKHDCLNCKHHQEHESLIEQCPNCGFYSYYTQEESETYDNEKYN